MSKVKYYQSQYVYIFEVSVKDILKIHAMEVNSDFEWTLLQELENKYTSINRVEWDVMTGPYIQIVLDSQDELEDIKESISDILSR